MIKKNVKLVVLVVLLLTMFCLSGFNFYKTYGYEEVCIAQRCTEWAYGNDWIKDNCQLENNQYSFCNIVMNGQSYKVPLEEINISQARSCRESECFTQIMVRTQEENK